MTREKSAVVTGAAGGIGRAISRRLAQAGWQVVLADLSEERLEELRSELEAVGLSATIRRTNVAESADVEALADLAASVAQLGTWVNAAGAIHRAPLLELTDEDWDRMMTANARSCFLGTRCAGQRMRPTGGSITNLASISSVTSLPNTSHYGAAKGAVASLTRHAALELGPLGIRVNAIAPGTILTPMTADRLASLEQQQQTLGKIPLGRIGEPKDIANIVTFIASEEAAYISGALIHVDGGWYASA